MATRDIIGPIALLIESLENLFHGIIKVVDEQYTTKSNIDFTDNESKCLFRILRGPTPLIVCFHLTIILFNAICIVFGLIYRGEYFMKCNMFILTSLLIVDASVFLTLIYKDSKLNIEIFLNELQKVQSHYLGAETNNFPTLLFNYIHQHFHCCGIHNYTEWLNPDLQWKRNVTYENKTYQIQIPISCCPNLTNDRLPRCAQSNPNYPPFNQGCSELLMNYPIFETTRISERFYTLVYFVAHIITISLFIVKTTLLKQKREILFLYHEGKICTEYDHELCVNNLNMMMIVDNESSGNNNNNRNNNNNNNQNILIDGLTERSIIGNNDMVREFGDESIRPDKSDSHFY
ncbi:unnamed protein product [Schistosoma turkestanicum]|nr:unnamed protein product [Schistosoma turkestanicum]